MDAALVAEFEEAAADRLQGDEELASALNSYTEARRKLTEKFRSRGFWPLTSGKSGKGKGKNKVKGKFGGKPRRSLEQRILTSKCRICDRVGHWKAECPERVTGSNPPTAPTSFVSAQISPSDAFPMEFMQIPEEKTLDEPWTSMCLMSWHESGSKYPKLQSCLKAKQKPFVSTSSVMNMLSLRNERSRMNASDDSEGFTCFATHGTLGVVDLGATKTVIGSQQVKELIAGLQPEIQKQLIRVPCHVTFRFGNHGTLQSQQALVVPIHGFRLKIAVVPGNIPFLVSNTLLRALKAKIDVDTHTIWSKYLQKEFPMQLSSRGLFLIDLNDLAAGKSSGSELLAETHLAAGPISQEKTGDPSPMQPDMPMQSNPVASALVQKSNDNLTVSKHRCHSENSGTEVEVSKTSTTFSVDSSGTVSHDRHCPAFAPSSGPCCGRAPRPQSPVGGTTGCQDCGLRPSPQGQDISSGVDSRSTMGDVVRLEVPLLHQDGTSHHDALYINLKLERAELAQQSLPMTTGAATATTSLPKSQSYAPKAKAKGVATSSIRPCDMPVPSDTELESALAEAMVEHQNNQMADMDNRMTQMERLMQNILQHLEKMSMTETSGHAATDPWEVP